MSGQVANLLLEVSQNPSCPGVQRLWDVDPWWGCSFS